MFFRSFNKVCLCALAFGSSDKDLVRTPLYYSRGPIGSREELSEDPGTKAAEPMKRAEGNPEPTIPTLNNNE